MAQAVSFASDSVGQCTEVLTLEGKCDLSTALEAERRILVALDSGRTEIIFDLRGVSSLGAAVLHVLFRGLIRAKGRGGSLVLVRPNAYVWDLFESSGLDGAFPTFLELRDAVVSAQQPSASPSSPASQV